MSKRTTERRKRRVCGEKHKYATKEDADRAAWHLMAWQGKLASAYQCKFCHAWHAGRTNKVKP